jgi:SAM-dependent methyltransferase
VQRLERRYGWARGYCIGKDVHELACGTAQGAGLLAAVARSFTASDGSQPMLDLAAKHYGTRIKLVQLDAQRLQLPEASLDVLVMFEALYYLPDAPAFFRRAFKVLRPGGMLLIATANKDLYDFNPSPYSHDYLGVVELAQQLGEAGFGCELLGDTPIAEVSSVQKLLRPVKNLASKLGLIPKSMGAKQLLKRLVFGKLVAMPAEIAYTPAGTGKHTALNPGVPDLGHKVIFCAARKPLNPT